MHLTLEPAHQTHPIANTYTSNAFICKYVKNKLQTLKKF